MANNILSHGQSFSLMSYSGSYNMTDEAAFVDSRDSNTKYGVRVQGFHWTGLSTLTVKDSNMVVIFKSTGRTITIKPNGASGSYGLAVTAPFYLTTVGEKYQGGYLTVYGEVM